MSCCHVHGRTQLELVTDRFSMLDYNHEIFADIPTLPNVPGVFDTFTDGGSLSPANYI